MDNMDTTPTTSVEPKQEPQELRRKIITVSGIVSTERKKDGTPYKNNNMRIVVTDGEGNKYNFWKNKADQTESKAFQAIKTGEVKQFNKTVVVYNESDEVFFNTEGKEISYKDRRVAFFTQSDDIAAQLAEGGEQPAPPPVAPEGEKDIDVATDIPF